MCCDTLHDILTNRQAYYRLIRAFVVAYRGTTTANKAIISQQAKRYSSEMKKRISTVFRSRTQTRHAMTTVSLNETFICSTCARALPVTEFRRRSKTSDSRMTKCRECHSAYERARRKKNQLQHNGRELQKFTTRIANSRRCKKTSNLVDLMVSRLGGPNKFWLVWMTEVDRSRTQKRSTLYALRFCEALIRMHRAVLREQFSYAGTEEEDNAELQHCLRRLFLTDPAMMARAAKQAGATIVWCDDPETAPD